MEKSDGLFKTIRELSDGGLSLEDMEAELDRRYGENCAAFVLDSTGFTRVTKARGTVFFLSIIEQMRAACVRVFQENQVIDWRTFADNMFAEFPSADLAVKSAFAIHEFFEENPVSLMSDEDVFGTSIGIGFGRMLRSENEGVYGNEMNLASKLGEDTAQRGETLLTEAAHAALTNTEQIDIEQRRMKISGIDVPIYSVRSKS